MWALGRRKPRESLPPPQSPFVWGWPAVFQLEGTTVSPLRPTETKLNCSRKAPYGSLSTTVLTFVKETLHSSSQKYLSLEFPGSSPRTCLLSPCSWSQTASKTSLLGQTGSCSVFSKKKSPAHADILIAYRILHDDGPHNITETGKMDVPNTCTSWTSRWPAHAHSPSRGPHAVSMALHFLHCQEQCETCY